jgi:anti-sigma regulatory factor (Ser/Thr protein kinase)
MHRPLAASNRRGWFVVGTDRLPTATFRLALRRCHRGAALRYLITFLSRRLNARKSAVTPRSPTFSGNHLAVGRLPPRPDLMALPADGSSASERELVLLDVACTEHAPGLVRAALRDVTELDAVRDDAILIASELVTNAVMQSGRSAAHQLHVRAILSGTDVLISVDDPGRSNEAPRMQDAEARRASGDGLRIVSQLARQWGCERSHGYRVWAQLAAAPSG